MNVNPSTIMESRHHKKANILVFETNIRFKKDITKVTPAINNEARIRKWNVDQQDKGKILRMETIDLHPSEVIMLIAKAGYSCAELTD
jgi:hypothetical protein